MLKIGLTGGIATGKSTVSHFLKQQGATVIDADRVARQVVAPGSPLLDRLVDAFGSEVVTDDGELDRGYLGQKVFADPAALEQLNELMQPIIKAKLLTDIETATQHIRLGTAAGDNAYSQLLVVDLPLLFEEGYEEYFDEVWVVTVPRAVQTRRLQSRNHLTQAEASERIASQWPLSEKIARADLIIDNAGTRAETHQQIKDYLASHPLV